MYRYEAPIPSRVINRNIQLISRVPKLTLCVFAIAHGALQGQAWWRTPTRFSTQGGAREVRMPPPAAAHGLDVDEQGQGTASQPRLHQLIRQRGSIADRTLDITFLAPGVEAYVFTFG
jgi:hypothetical protein